MTRLHLDLPENAVLPLVLVTVGSANDEIEALQLHLDGVAQEAEPRFQSLIVARPDIPKMFYNVMCERVRSLPSVHVLRLGDNNQEYSEHLHESGTFLASRKRSRKEG